jgi:heat shock protein HslJ
MAGESSMKVYFLATCLGCSLMLACSGSHKPAQATTPAAPAVQPGPTLNLVGSEWLLEDLGGSGVLDRVQATLAFPESGKVAGKGSCNRFFGTVAISGHTIKFSAMGSTKMACPEPIMNQEEKYLAALQAADRFESKDGNLLIYYAGAEKPLRFSPLPHSAAREPGYETTELSGGYPVLVTMPSSDRSPPLLSLDESGGLNSRRRDELAAGESQSTSRM